jgi:hypothetical protein
VLGAIVIVVPRLPRLKEGGDTDERLVAVAG